MNTKYMCSVTPSGPIIDIYMWGPPRTKISGFQLDYLYRAHMDRLTYFNTKSLFKYLSHFTVGCYPLPGL